MRGLRLLVCVLSAAVLGVQAEVYLLHPRPLLSQNVSLQQLPGISAKPLHSESVEINGMPLTLHFYASSSSFPELAAFIRTHFSGTVPAGESCTIRLRMKKEGRPEVRALVIGSGPKRPVTVIALELPRKLPPPVWPKELPQLPNGAVPVQITCFPKQGAVCGEFAGASSLPQNHLRSLASQLRAGNWQPGAAEHRSSLGGKGDVFIRFQPRREILLVAFHEDGSGTFFLQPQP